MRRTYEAGETLFHQGDPSDTVYQIDFGTVLVVKEYDGERIVLGRLGAGEFLGEMGALEDLERSATAIAEDPVEAEVYGKAEFLTLVSADATLALNLLRRLSARLRDMNNQLAAAGHPAQPVTTPQAVSLRAESLALKFVIGNEAIAITTFPYSVGRYSDPGGEPGQDAADLLIEDPEPYRLSPVHFRLLEEHGAIVVKDSYTELGTIVNGKSLGQDFPIESVALDPGDNEIIAGGERSPYHFVVTLSS
jgi:CRP-like cAMP-binding protein